MFLLDTNVVSELRKVGDGKAEDNVVAWASSVDAATLHLSVITLMEMEVGVLRIERRDAAQGGRLRAWMDQYLLPEFQGRVLQSRLACRCGRGASLCAPPCAGPTHGTGRPDRGDGLGALHDRCDPERCGLCGHRRTALEPLGYSLTTLLRKNE